ncbi:MAG: DMT family transporter [Flavobacteriales bacterium]|nr:DMT family transporter [Flavobacteriales bacterium]
MPSRRYEALLLLHLTVFIWGWTGILGKLIDQSSLQLVLMRSIIALAGLGAWAVYARRTLFAEPREILQYLLTSVLITGHWLTFYGAIKISTASIAVACLSTSTVFTALMEPFWYKRRIRTYEVVLGLVVIAALLLIFGLETKHRLGIVVATVSALLSAWFNVVNGVLVKRGDALRIGFYELLGVMLALYACIGLAAWLPADLLHSTPALTFLAGESLPPVLWSLPADQVVYHLLLGLVCTSFAFVAGIAVMRQLSPFTVMLTVNLEPVYTIVIALLIWGSEERLTTGSYIGFALILACLFLNGWWQRRKTALETTEPDPLAQG